MKRIVSLILCAVLVLGMLPAVSAQAAETELPEGVIVHAGAENAPAAIISAPELPVASIGDPLEGIQPMDIWQYDDAEDIYYFETFEDLQELAAGTYTTLSWAAYYGEEDLVISQNLTLPENLIIFSDYNGLLINEEVTFVANANVSFLDITINGDMTIRNGNVSAKRSLAVNGSLRIFGEYGVGIRNTTVFTGRSNISGENYMIRVSYYDVSSVSELESVLAVVNANTDPYYKYYIQLSLDKAGTAFHIDKNITIPSNAYFNAYDAFEECSRTIVVETGVTFTPDGGASFRNITVNGTLVNNDSICVYGEMTCRDNDAYEGSGLLIVLPESTDLSYEDVIFGLDLSRFTLTNYSEEYHFYFLVDNSGMKKLETPTGLMWGYDVDYSGNLIERPGSVVWKTGDTLGMETVFFRVCVYKIGQTDLFSCWDSPGAAGTEWTSLPLSLFDNFETGTYYFTVQALGDGSTILNSDIATSGEWTYNKPSRQVPTPSGLHWNWPYAAWSVYGDTSDVGRIEVIFYYSKTADEEPVWAGSSSAMVSEEYPYDVLCSSFNLYHYPVETHGAGYYYFSVKLCSKDITVAANAEESPISPGFYYNPADHAYVADRVVEPTCTEQGYTDYRCPICYGTYRGNYVDPLGHNYVDGICTRCGAADPGYVPPKPAVDGVTRLAGAGRVETCLEIAVALKERMGVTQFPNVVVASALNFPDALAGSYLAAKMDAPILLTMNSYHVNILGYISANLAPGGTVYILGGTSAVPADFTDMLTQSNIHWERIAGNDRFGTNLEILNRAGVTTGQTILVCTGTGFADSLSVSATGHPILLVGTTLTASQKDFLNRCGGGKFYIIGGTGAVSETVETELRGYASEVERLAGAGRHETSVLVANEFFPDAESAVIAYSMNFPDGLSGGPLAYNIGAPLILTNSSDTCVNAYTDHKAIDNGYVLGGNGLINDVAVRRIFHMSTADSIN